MAYTRLMASGIGKPTVVYTSLKDADFARLETNDRYMFDLGYEYEYHG